VQQTKSQNILNYEKILLAQTILGQRFDVRLYVYCDLLIYANYNNQVRCYGVVKYTIFNKNKQITVFDYTKSVWSGWSYYNRLAGSWAFNIYIPLPPPVSFIGINFYISIGYFIDLNLYATTQNFANNPYIFKTGAAVSTGITTDSRASLRVIAIEGGVYIRGTLAQLRSDPYIQLSYYFTDRKIQLATIWNF
jgi:hypothetical protein